MFNSVLCGNTFFINNFIASPIIGNPNIKYVRYNYLNGSSNNNHWWKNEYNELAKEQNNILFNLPNETEEITINNVYIYDVGSFNKFREYFYNLPISLNKITIYEIEIQFYNINKLLNNEYEYLKTSFKKAKELKQNIKSLLFNKLPYECKVKINKILIT